MGTGLCRDCEGPSSSRGPAVREGAFRRVLYLTGENSLDSRTRRLMKQATRRGRTADAGDLREPLVGRVCDGLRSHRRWRPDQRLCGRSEAISLRLWLIRWRSRADLLSIYRIRLGEP